MASRFGRCAAAAAVIAATIVGCGTGPGAQQVATPAHLAHTSAYLPGVDADVYLPSSSPSRPPVVVLVPGGAWLTAERSGLGPLADALAEHGMVAVNATYRTADTGARFPVPVQDIVCSISFGVAEARAAGYTPGPVVVLGHSSGAHLAALAALATNHFRAPMPLQCPYPAVVVDGLIGLAGPYDIRLYQQLARPLFGVGADTNPAIWQEGNPMSWLGGAAGGHVLNVLLAHGDADDLVSPGSTQMFGSALQTAGYPVTVKMIHGADHASIYRPEVIAKTIVEWMAQLPATAVAPPR